MNQGVDPLPETAEFESGTFPVGVIIVWRHHGGWHVGTVLFRVGDGPVAAQTPWEEPFFDDTPNPWDRSWRYLAERIREGRGGNAYTYELEAFEVSTPDDVTPVVTARAAEVVAASHGETGGTVLFDDPPGRG